MKSKLFLIVLIAVNVFGGLAQNKPERAATTQTEDTGKFWIYWASYTKWGHGEHCVGWGLCNYSDCWFCEVADKHTAKVIIDKITKTGEMLIVLDPKQAQEQMAISQKLFFSIDRDIDNVNSIVLKGQYPFDATVGDYGGYRLLIQLK